VTSCTGSGAEGADADAAGDADVAAAAALDEGGLDASFCAMAASDHEAIACASASARPAPKDHRTSAWYLHRVLRSRTITAFLVVAGALFAACSTSSGPPGEGNPIFDAGNLDATFPEDAGGEAAADATEGTNLVDCLAGVLTSSPPAVCLPFIQCIQSNCSADLSTACFGAWATGTVGGDCSSFETCAASRGCTPLAGVGCFPSATSSCQQCVTNLVSCATSPTCASAFTECEDGLLRGLTGMQTDASMADAGEAGSATADSGVDSGTTVTGMDAGPGDSSTGLDASPDAVAPEAGSGPDAGPVGFGPITSVSVGDGSACGLTSAGGVVCWGSNSNGQLGNGSTNSSVVPVQVTGLTSGVISVSVGPSPSACAVTAAGGVVCWGANASGELGNGAMTDSHVPVPVTGLTSGVASVTVGTFDACALTTSGAVWCWGDNTQGQLGNGSMTSSAVPVPVTALGNGVLSVSIGEAFGCAVTAVGGISCWGTNGNGELGNGTQTSSAVPVPVSGINSGATSVSVGLYTACAVVAGSAVCWGENSDGVLGSGSAAVWSLTPVQVSGLTSGVLSVSIQEATACAMLAGGDVMCWGEGNGGVLGNGSTADSSVPVLVQGLSGGVTSVSAGFASTCASVGCGVQCWGDTGLGNTVTTSSSVPVSVELVGTGSCLPGFGAAVSVSVGNPFACALTSAGAVVCWGDNSEGELGNGSSVTYSAVPVQVTGLTSGVKSISAGDESAACAVTSAGAVVCWGDNSDGELGNGSSVAYSAVPVQVTGLTSGVTSVSVGILETCALTAGGGVVCWGNNSDGQLGNGSAVSFSNVPVQVTGLTSGVTSVAVGGDFACAVIAGGAVVCWGGNEFGELGDGSPSDSSVPVAVMGITGATAVSAGNFTACANVAGALSCWGYGGDGELGDGLFSPSYSSVPVSVSSLSGVSSVAGNYQTTCAVAVSGDVLCWGYNESGALGDGTSGPMASSAVPVPVTGLTTGATSPAASFGASCAVVACGVQCWGANAAGQLGDGTEDDSLVPVPVSLLGANPCP
jgi:alpha-tubulin suppressor-like RCC1 family protein